MGRRALYSGGQACFFARTTSQPGSSTAAARALNHLVPFIVILSPCARNCGIYFKKKKKLEDETTPKGRVSLLKAFIACGAPMPVFLIMQHSI